MKLLSSNATSLLLIALLALSPSANAAVPDGINYQAYLTDNAGAPIDTDVSITFAAYNVPVGGVPLWSATQLVSPDSGLFTTTLGNPANPFPAGLFDGPVYVGLFVAGEEMLPRRSLQSTGYAFKAADADTLTGFSATDLDQSTEVSDLASDLANVQNDVSSTQANLQNTTNDVAGNTSDIANNAANIATNTTAIANNDSRISTLEINPGDITSVSAGSGMTGGGASGDVALSIANAGVTANMLATNSVTSSKIADGSVGAADINSNQDFTVRGLTATGQVEIDSQFDIRINDDYNGLRWRTSDGATSLASIEVRESDALFRDNVRNRVVFESNASGIGIGTATPTAGYDVTIPNLIVTGNTNIGFERVTSTYGLDIMSSSCHSHGNLPCYYGATSVSCPVGKKLIGGGTSGSSGIFGSISISAPINTLSYQCGASYDIANSTRTCYAICARVD